MNKPLIFLFAALTSALFSFGQAANRISNTQMPVRNYYGSAFLWMDTTAGQQNQIYATWFDSLRLKYINAQWTKDSSYAWGDPRYKAIGYVPAWTDITGKPTIPAAQVNSDWNSVSGVSQVLNKPTIPLADSLAFYTSSGRVNQKMKVWTAANLTPSTASGYSIDISSAGFSTILSVSVIASRNASTAYTSPNVSIKSKSTSAIVVNIVEDNLSVVSILGINVLSGYPSVFANTSGLTIDVIVIGY